MLRQLRKLRRQREDSSRHQQNQPPVRITYERFIREYNNVLAILQPRASFIILQQLFADPARAWKCGIGTLRGISDGRLPQNLSEVIAFLCVCKAVSETLDFHTDSNYTTKFLDDLRRWAILFDTESEFRMYKDLVRDIWRVNLQMEFGESPSLDMDVDLLQYAQGLVSSLVHDAKDFIEPMSSSHHGLEASQRRWRDRQGLPPPFARIPEPFDRKGPDDTPNGSSHSLGREIHDHISSTQVTLKVVVIMTGAIFMILLVFLCCKSWPEIGDNRLVLFMSGTNAFQGFETLSRTTMRPISAFFQLQFSPTQMSTMPPTPS
jgi:hypothetical protein